MGSLGVRLASLNPNEGAPGCDLQSTSLSRSFKGVATVCLRWRHIGFVYYQIRFSYERNLSPTSTIRSPPPCLSFLFFLPPLFVCSRNQGISPFLSLLLPLFLYLLSSKHFFPSLCFSTASHCLSLPYKFKYTAQIQLLKLSAIKKFMAKV